MPQMPKLTIRTPITVAMIILPSQFDEALRNPRSIGVQLVGRRKPVRTRRNSIPNTAKGCVTGLITHHKVTAIRSQLGCRSLRAHQPAERVNGGDRPYPASWQIRTGSVSDGGNLSPR